MTPSEWARSMWEKTLDDNYIKLYELWTSRGM